MCIWCAIILYSIKISETIKVGDRVEQRSFIVNPHPEPLCDRQAAQLLDDTAGGGIICRHRDRSHQRTPVLVCGTRANDHQNPSPPLPTNFLSGI